MLETLDSVDWNSIHHAYGPARDVPDLLRAAVLADPDRVSNQTIELLTGEVPEKAVCVHTGSLSVLVTRCLARLPAERKNRAIQAVVNHYRRDLPMDALSLTRTLLELAFGQESAPRSSSQLTRDQRLVVQAIHDHAPFQLGLGLA